MRARRRRNELGMAPSGNPTGPLPALTLPVFRMNQVKSLILPVLGAVVLLEAATYWFFISRIGLFVPSMETVCTTLLGIFILIEAVLRREPSDDIDPIDTVLTVPMIEAEADFCLRAGAAIMLIFPGMLTDIVGLFILLPVVRKATGRKIVAWGLARSNGAGSAGAVLSE